MPCLPIAEAGGDTVAVTAEVDGETERGEGWFRIDRTIVDIELHTEHTADEGIDRALDATLDHIQEQVEA